MVIKFNYAITTAVEYLHKDVVCKLAPNNQK
jgi:hypothetical protein